MSQKSKSKWILSIALPAAVLIVIFLIYRNRQLNETINDMKLSLEKSSELSQEERLMAKADSQLLTGNYKVALGDYAELDGPEAEMKRALAERLLDFRKEIDRQSLSIENLLQRDTTDVDLNKFASLRAYDSLSFALEKTKMQLRSIREQLKTKSFGEYITFASTKGNRLHYVGQVKNKKANGYGIAILDSGSRYEGEWKDNMRHGQGAFYWIDGEHYEGSYVNDLRSGFGTYYWPNGERFEGYWEEDERNGRGTFYNAQGEVVASGVWESDELIQEDE